MRGYPTLYFGLYWSLYHNDDALGCVAHDYKKRWVERTFGAATMLEPVLWRGEDHPEDGKRKQRKLTRGQLGLTVIAREVQVAKPRKRGTQKKANAKKGKKIDWGDFA